MQNRYDQQRQTQTAEKGEEKIKGRAGNVQYFVLLGRVFYSAIFLMSAPGLFNDRIIGYAMSYGVPMAAILVPVAGIIAFLGGLSVLLGYKARYGAWALIIFLVPVTLTMHNFWAISDPGQAQMQQINFMKNLSMLGAAFLIAYFGSGPLSLDKGKL